MKHLRTLLVFVCVAAAAITGCDSADSALFAATAEQGAGAEALATVPVAESPATPLAFDGEAQFWWEADFVTLPSCDGTLLTQEVDLRVKLGKLDGTAPVPHSLLITSLNVESWELVLIKVVDIDESHLRANDGQLRLSFDVDMETLGLECGSPANLMMVQAVGAAGYGRELDEVGMTSLTTFGCESTSVGFSGPVLECSSSCGTKERSLGFLCAQAYVPATIDVHFYDLKQGQLLSGLSTELEWTDEPSLGSVTATNIWRGAAASTSAHQLKVVTARDANGEIMSVLGL